MQEDRRVNRSWKRRRLILWAGVLLLGGAVWLAVYAWDQGFTRKWRGLIARELAKHGLRAEIGRLTIDPVEGLTARDVKLFDLMHRNEHLADIDRISLDIDLVRLVNSEDFLRTLHLQKADVVLPVDPGDPRSEWVTVRDLNARLVFHPDQIEIAQAEGEVSGILVKASGKVSKPPGVPKSPEDKERLREERSRKLREMRDRRGILRSILRGLDRFQIPAEGGIPERPHKAEMVLELKGDLSDPNLLQVRAALSGGRLKHQGGMLESFEASASLEEGKLTLERLGMRDAHGSLQASAAWVVGERTHVDLAVDCSMDLQGLLRTALEDAPWLGEVVCYSPPQWSWEGQWLLSEPRPVKFPVVGQGQIKVGHFSTRGVVFDGLQAKVALKPDGELYLRGGVLRHHSGEVRGQFLLGPEMGRYELDWRMSPDPLRPFLPAGAWRPVLDRFAFGRESAISIRMQGDRTGLEGGWRQSGQFQLRDFSYQGTALREASAEISLNPSAEVPLQFRKALLEMEDGKGRARELAVDLRAGLLRFAGAESTLMPAPLLKMFVPALGKELEKYRFEHPPESRLEGVIDLQGLARSDYRIRLRTRSRCGFDVAGQPLNLEHASGTLHVRGPQLEIQLTGATQSGAELLDVLTFADSAPVTFSGQFPLGREKAAPPQWQAELRTPGRVEVRVLERTWPVDQFAGKVESKGARITGTGGGQFLDGKLGASLDFPDQRRPGHSGSVVVENASFSRLAGILEPGRKTEGKVSGTFTYQIPETPGALVTGKGEASVENANIFALPLLGPLSGLVSALLPGENVAYSVARNATMTFEVGGGKVTLPDFAAATRTFRLTASGMADYRKDKVDFLARINLRGPPGMLLYPVSKLFEYSAGGTLSEPAWSPRFLPVPFRDKPEGPGEAPLPVPAARPLLQNNR